MNSSPTTIRMAEVRISSAPMIGPTVLRRRGSPAPNLSSSSVSSSANSVPSAIGGGVGSADGLADADEDAVVDGLADGSAEADAAAEGEATADPEAEAEAEGDGAGVCAGTRSIGSVRILRNPSLSSVTSASGYPSSASVAVMSAADGWSA